MFIVVALADHHAKNDPVQPTPSPVPAPVFLVANPIDRQLAIIFYAMRRLARPHGPPVDAERTHRARNSFARHSKSRSYFNARQPIIPIQPCEQCSALFSIRRQFPSRRCQDDARTLSITHGLLISFRSPFYAARSTHKDAPRFGFIPASRCGAPVPLPNRSDGRIRAAQPCSNLVGR